MIINSVYQAKIMTKKSLSAEDSKRICKHMNEDHAEAVVAYARHYGNRSKASKAKMLEISSESMKLEVDGQLMEIPFDHKLNDSEDAHRTLVSMLRQLPKPT